MSDAPPPFDTDTTKPFLIIDPDAPVIEHGQPTSIHARILGEKKEHYCDIGGFDRCKEPFKNVQGLGNHKRQKHQPKTGEIFSNDIIRVAFKTTTSPVWDPEHDLFIFPDVIKLPDGFDILYMEKGSSSMRDPLKPNIFHGVVRVTLAKSKRVIKK